MNSVSKLYQVFEENKTLGSDRSIDPDKLKIQDMLSNLFVSGPSFYFIFDFTRFEFDFVSEPVSTIMNVQPSEFRLAAFMESIHPEDRDYFVQCVSSIVDFLLRRIEPGDLTHFKASFQYRMKGENGYRLVLHQALPVSVDKQGRLSKFLGSISEIHHITNFNNRKLSMIGLNGRPTHFNVRPRNESAGNRQAENNYSDRELQILRLVAEGLSNMDISRKLSISVGTVRTHRKNILTKSSAANSVQAVADAIRNEMI